MAQSVEHEFVTNCFIEISNSLSRSKLYGYREADRGGFDFACVLTRNRSRALGSTHGSGWPTIESSATPSFFPEDADPEDAERPVLPVEL